jgi:hypothetical protein
LLLDVAPRVAGLQRPPTELVLQLLHGANTLATVNGRTRTEKAAHLIDGRWEQADVFPVVRTVANVQKSGTLQSTPRLLPKQPEHSPGGVKVPCLHARRPAEADAECFSVV